MLEVARKLRLEKEREKEQQNQRLEQRTAINHCKQHCKRSSPGETSCCEAARAGAAAGRPGSAAGARDQGRPVYKTNKKHMCVIKHVNTYVKHIQSYKSHKILEILLAKCKKNCVWYRLLLQSLYFRVIMTLNLWSLIFLDISYPLFFSRQGKSFNLV